MMTVEELPNDGVARISGGGTVRRLEVRRVIDAPIERVWQALTDAREVEKWWAPGEIDAREGGRILLYGDAEDCGEGAKPLDGVIKVFQPPHLFEYSWNEAAGESVVRFDLMGLEDDRTQVILTDIVAVKDLVVVATGWHLLVERLGSCAQSGAAVPEDEQRGVELHDFYARAFQTTSNGARRNG